MKKEQWNRCDICQQFIPYDFIDKGGSGAFIPDSEFGPERMYYRCKKCTEEHGQCEKDYLPITSYYF